jgi:uncharacterized protein (DUF427 family)
MTETAGTPTIAFKRTSKRIRAVLGGETVLDTQDALLLKEGKRPPRYYIPVTDIAADKFHKTEHSTHCPYKGDASYWSISADGKTVENAAWGYETPSKIVAPIKGHISVEWKTMDAWLEEDEEVIVHPRDPHTRVDIVESSRPVRVELDGVTLAETTKARFLFETGKVIRYYIPRDDVAMEYLKPSDSVTACPYKGYASYFSVQTPKGEYEDLVWYYTEPFDECLRIKDYLCFYNEKVSGIYVDGKPAPSAVGSG